MGKGVCENRRALRKANRASQGEMKGRRSNRKMGPSFRNFSIVDEVSWISKRSAQKPEAFTHPIRKQ